MDKAHLEELRQQPEWLGKLGVVLAAKKDAKYELHPTGNADVNGRSYVAIPKGTILTKDIKRQYNLNI